LESAAATEDHGIAGRFNVSEPRLGFRAAAVDAKNDGRVR
jgi:hypothetical protein